MELCLKLERFPPQAGLEPETARSVGQHLTYVATEALIKRQALMSVLLFLTDLANLQAIFRFLSKSHIPYLEIL